MKFKLRRPRAASTSVSEAQFRQALLQRLAAIDPQTQFVRGFDPQAPDRLSRRYGATQWELAFAELEPGQVCLRVQQAVERFKASSVKLRESLTEHWMQLLLTGSAVVGWVNGEPQAIRSRVEEVYHQGIDAWLAENSNGEDEFIVQQIRQGTGDEQGVAALCQVMEQFARQQFVA